MNQKSTPQASEATAFIPDLCQVQAVLRIVIATELGALLFTLVHSGPGTFDWEFLARTSLFMLWIALTSATALCLARYRLAFRPAASQARWAYFIVITVTVIYSLVAELVRLLAWDQSPWEWRGSINGYFLLYCGVISAILGGVVLRYLYLQHLGEIQAKAGLEAHVQALQARIRPHFLFNSMNSIAGLIPVDPYQAEEAVIDLAELFRSALRPSADLVTLGAELAICERYLRIEKLRLGDRLTIEWQIDPACNRILLPPLCLQPLLENAIYHGIQPLPQGGVLSVRAYVQSRSLYIEVKNPVPDNSKATRADYDDSEASLTHSGNRLALDNIRSRLLVFYGESAKLKTSRQDAQFTAILRIPVKEPKHDASRIHS